MAVSGADKPPFPEEEGSPSSPIPFRTILMFSPQETINSIIAGISNLTRLPASKLRLHDGTGRELPGDLPISNCGLQNDYTNLLLSFSDSTAAAGKIVSFITQLFSQTIQNPGFLKVFANLFYNFVGMTPIDRGEEDIVAHLQSFIFSGVHISLGKLYKSPLLYHRHFARYGLNLFLRLNKKRLPQSFDIHYLSVLLELSQSFSRTGGRENPLYHQCRGAIGQLLNSNDWIFYNHSNMENMVFSLYPLVVDLVEDIATSLSPNCISFPPIVQLNCFLKQLRKEFKEREASEEHLSIETENLERFWSMNLQCALFKLKRKLTKSLEGIETTMAEKTEGELKFYLRPRLKIIEVLFCFNQLCKLFGLDDKLVRPLLVARRTPLNALIRHAGTRHKQIWLLEYKEALDFEMKKRLLMMLFADTDDRGTYRDYYVYIDRLHLLSDSLVQIVYADAYELHAELSVVFVDEEGTGHGVMREWFYLVFNETFSSHMNLFSSCPADRRRFFPNPVACTLNRTKFLEYYKFAGRLVGLAMRHELQMGITFDSIFFKQLAGHCIDLEDLQDADPTLYMSCKKLLEMDDEVLDSDELGLTFVRETEELGSRKTIALCDGGEDIVVNSNNKWEFVSLLVQSYYVGSIREQIQCFRKGFGDLFFNYKFDELFFWSLSLEEFDQMLRGSEEKINIDDWKNHTTYGGYTAEDQEIISFWKVVEGMQEEQRKILLQFWTSIRFLPVGGFCNLPNKLYISNTFDEEDDDLPLPLPTSQTCFYQLQLPPYPSMSIMQQNLHLITQEHVSCTFGLY